MYFFYNLKQREYYLFKIKRREDTTTQARRVSLEFTFPLDGTSNLTIYLLGSYVYKEVTRLRKRVHFHIV